MSYVDRTISHELLGGGRITIEEYYTRRTSDPAYKAMQEKIAAEIEEETAYLNQGDGKDEKRRLVIRLIGDIRGSDGYGGIGSRGAIQLCRAIEEMMK
jgi:hypothetical protein